MQTRTLILATLLLAGNVCFAGAGAKYTGNPVSPYPPSCVSGPLEELDLTSENAALFYSDRVWLEVVSKIESDDPFSNLGEVQLDMYRVACAEPNRSLIIAEFRLPPEWVDPRKSKLVLPWLGGNTAMDPFPLAFKREANSWGQDPTQFLLSRKTFGDYTGGWDDPRQFVWRYILDVHAYGAGWDRDDTSIYYNGGFAFFLYRNDGEHFLTIDVPATRGVLESVARLPLNGRLSGNWVEHGAADQGFLISVSSPLPLPGEAIEDPVDSSLLIFLSWFTFDAQGEMLWLTGAARFAQGADEVLVPIEQVTQGTFLGGSPAQRTTVGSVLLRARDCNRLELNFDLTDAGLGSGTMQLERLLALEIADYPCRDYEGLQSSIYSPEQN